MDAGAVIGADSLLSAAPPTPVTPLLSRWTHSLSQHHQHLLDKSTPHVLRRWIALAAVALVYLVRVSVIQGFFLVSYCLGIYIINLLIGFLSPQVDPEIDAAVTSTGDGDSPTLPVRRSDEFRPFVRRLPEFKFWYSITKGFVIAFVMTFFSVLDVPVCWPILLFYWIALFILIMRKQISHMIKYKYVPFSTGKQQYDKRKPAATENTSLTRD